LPGAVAATGAARVAGARHGGAFEEQLRAARRPGDEALDMAISRLVIMRIPVGRTAGMGCCGRRMSRRHRVRRAVRGGAAEAGGGGHEPRPRPVWSPRSSVLIWTRGRPGVLAGDTCARAQRIASNAMAREANWEVSQAVRWVTCAVIGSRTGPRVSASFQHHEPRGTGNRVRYDRGCARDRQGGSKGGAREGQSSRAIVLLLEEDELDEVRREAPHTIDIEAFRSGAGGGTYYLDAW